MKLISQSKWASNHNRLLLEIYISFRLFVTKLKAFILFFIIIANLSSSSHHNNLYLLEESEFVCTKFFFLSRHLELTSLNLLASKERERALSQVNSGVKTTTNIVATTYSNELVTKKGSLVFTSTQQRVHPRTQSVDLVKCETGQFKHADLAGAYHQQQIDDSTSVVHVSRLGVFLLVRIVRISEFLLAFQRCLFVLMFGELCNWNNYN